MDYLHIPNTPANETILPTILYLNILLFYFIEFILLYFSEKEKIEFDLRGTFFPCVLFKKKKKILTVQSSLPFFADFCFGHSDIEFWSHSRNVNFHFVSFFFLCTELLQTLRPSRIKKLNLESVCLNFYICTATFQLPG